MQMAKRQRQRKARENGMKDNLWTGVRISGETNMPPSWLAQFMQGRLNGEDKLYKRKKPIRIEASPLGLAHPHTSRVYYPLLNKTEL